MRRPNIQILRLTFLASAICIPTAVFIPSRASVTDGSLMELGWAGRHSTWATATGFMDRNLDGPLLEANRGDGCLTTTAAGISSLGPVGCGFLAGSAEATCRLDTIRLRQRLCVPAAP